MTTEAKPGATALTVLQQFFAAEAAYVEGGGPGRAGFDEMASCLDPGVVMHQAPSLPYGVAGTATTGSRTS